MTCVAVSGLGEATESAQDSLETLIFRSATAALNEAGLERQDLDGVVIAASDQVDGRAISSMLTSGPAGAYLIDEVNMASSPGHALIMAYMQILSGTHRRLLVSSWGKASETAAPNTQPAERLSAEPFFDRDAGLSALAATAIQAQLLRVSERDPQRVDEAAARIAARNHGGVSPDEIADSPVVAYPLRQLECPPEVDGSYSLVLEHCDRMAQGDIRLAGVGWCSDSSMLANRDLIRMPHLVRAVEDAYGRAQVSNPPRTTQVWELHDYSPHAEMLAYAAIGLCESSGVLDLVRETTSSANGRRRVNPSGGSVRGEAPFGGAMKKVIAAVRQLRGDAGEGQVHGADRALAQISSGFAGQFQSAFVLQRA